MGTPMNPNAPNHLDLSAAGNGDDFFDQMLCTIPSWDLVNPSGFDESAILVSRLRQYQIDGGDGGSPAPAGKPSIRQAASDPDSALLMPLPLSLGHCSNSDSSFKSPIPAIAEGLYSGFVGGSLQGSATQPQHFHQPQGGTMPQQSFGGAPPATVAAPRPRVRARRGQATDPHSIAERLRRERIAERMKALQELVPNANKTDKASMLDEIIDYVKFLQLQVKVLSVSRLGGAAAVAPLVADISSEGGAPAGRGLSSAAAAAASENMSATERQVAKLMEEDMGSAMQYLQGKGLCLMPISLASAISTATCRGPNPGLLAGFVAGISQSADIAPSSPSLSVLTVQSAVAAGSADTGKDGAASVSSK